jgi:hypothetical protein
MEERLRGEDPMFVLNGDLPEGGGREDFVLLSSLRLFRACAESNSRSASGQNIGIRTGRLCSVIPMGGSRRVGAFSGDENMPSISSTPKLSRAFSGNVIPVLLL